MPTFLITLWSAILRGFGFGTKAKPPETDAVPSSPMFQRLLDQAKALKDSPPPEPMPWGEAVNILARQAGQRPASEAAPPVPRVEMARAVLPVVILQYLYVLEVLGRTFPKVGSEGEVDPGRAFPKVGSVAETNFRERLEELALTDVNTWLAGLYSDEPVTIPAHITAVLIQRAANALGQLQPRVMPEGRRPDFIAEAETQMYVIDLATKFCVFPRVIGRGNAPFIEVANTGRRFCRKTADLSGWDFRLGYAGQVFEPPANREAARDADAPTADLTPKSNPK